MNPGTRFVIKIICVFAVSVLLGCGGESKVNSSESTGTLEEALLEDTTQVARPGLPQPPNTQPLSSAEQKQIAEAEHELDLWLEKFLKNEEWETVMHDYKVALVKSNKLGEKMDAEAFRGFLDSLVYLNRLDFIIPTVAIKPQVKGINLKGFKTVLEVFDDDAQALPPASSLHGFYRAFDTIANAKNISPKLLAQVFIDGIRPEDLGKPLYQNIILIFLMETVNAAPGLRREFPKG